MGPSKLPCFTEAQRLQVRESLDQLQCSVDWSGKLPVLLLNRCWLRLTVVPVERLAVELPPDLSRAAPELVRYRELMEAGLPAQQAQQQCWLEFGPEACHQALQRFWNAQDLGPHGWTLQHYLDFLAAYRQRFLRQRPRPLPLLVLARPSGGLSSSPAVEKDGLFWLRLDSHMAEPSMRHTCA